MAGGKKNKSSRNPKKSKSRKNNKDGNDGKRKNINTKKNPISLDEVLDRAESAMEMFDLDGAVTLFTYAKEILTARVHAPASMRDGSECNGGDSSVQDRAILSNVLGKLGEIQASNGDSDGARKYFLDAIELMGPISTANEDSQGNIIKIAQNCEKRAGLHLYMGQLSSGMEALNCFRVGVSELEHAVSVLEGECAPGATAVDSVHCDETDLVNLQQYLIETRRQLCAAFCSIAELYLTDLCEEPDAESLCEAALNSALKLDEASSADSTPGSGDGSNAPPPPDALQTIANFRLSQCRVPDAAVCILKAYERMKVGCEAMSALVGLADDDGDTKSDEKLLEAKSCELVDVDAASSLPEYSFRCQTAKIMLECASLLENNETNTKNQCAESAIQVLGSLLAEDDEVIEVWYLLGCAFKACIPSNDESAHYYWEHALSMLKRNKEDMEKSLEEEGDMNDEYELDAIECQMTEVKNKLGLNSDEESEDEKGDIEMMHE